MAETKTPRPNQKMDSISHLHGKGKTR
jgi:hypothetical protein